MNPGAGLVGSTVDNVLQQLKGVKRTGSHQWEALCPAHEDRKPSLSIGEGDDGRVLLTCQANCDTAAVVAAMGLQMSDLFPDSGRSQSGRRSEIVAEYDYTDEEGAQLFQVVRFLPKDFRQRKPDGAGGWSWKLNGVRRVLYRLPQVREAIRDGRTVCLVEGEKDVHELEARGFAATTCPGGAGKWRPEYTESLRGGRILLLPDNDDPGKQHARDVGEELLKAECEVRVLELPGLPPKGDVSDWFAGGGTADELKRLARETRPEGPEGLPRAQSLADLPPPAPVPFAVDTLMTAREPALIVSDDGAGKTTLLLTILAAGCAEEPVFDRFEVTPGPALLVSEEDPANVLANHAEAIARGHGWDWSLIQRRLHILALEGVQLDQEVWRLHVLEEAKRVGAVLVGLDPYADLTNAKENDNDETRPFKAFLRELAKGGATPIVCHHAGKAVEGKRKRDRIRGASALTAAARSIWFLEENEMGVAVECLKLSRSVRPRPFVVSREIEAEPGNPANWRTARFAFVTEQQAEEDAADRFILDNLARYPFSKSTEIRELAQGTGLSAPQISASLKRLHLLQRIAFEPGKRNAKLWYRPDVTSLPRNVGQAGQATLSSLSEPAGQAREATDDPALYIEKAGSGKVPESAGQARFEDYESEWEELQEGESE